MVVLRPSSLIRAVGWSLPIAALVWCLLVAQALPTADPPDDAEPPPAMDLVPLDSEARFDVWQTAYRNAVDELAEKETERLAAAASASPPGQFEPAYELTRHFDQVVDRCGRAAADHPLFLEGEAPERRLVIGWLATSARLFDQLLESQYVRPGNLVLTLKETCGVGLDAAWERPLRRSLEHELDVQERCAALALLHRLAPEDAEVTSELSQLARDPSARFGADALRALLFQPSHQPCHARPIYADANTRLAEEALPEASSPRVREVAAQYVWCRGNTGEATAVLLTLLEHPYGDDEPSRPNSHADWFQAKLAAMRWLFYEVRTPEAFRAIWERAHVAHSGHTSLSAEYSQREESRQAYYLLKQVLPTD